MDAIALIGIVAILIGYLNLYLILKKEKPVINIYNQIPGLTKYDYTSSTGTTNEIPIDSTTIAIKDIKGNVNLDNEKLGKVDVSELTDKIKYMRNK